MARLTPEELAAARKARAAERAADGQAEEEQRQAEEKALEAQREWAAFAEDRSPELQNVALGLYEELDKQAKKWPQMPVTQRTVTRVNKLLGEARELLKDEEDDFAAGLEDIQPAGDLPESRDVVMLLREVRDALERFDERNEALFARLKRTRSR